MIPAGEREDYVGGIGSHSLFARLDLDDKLILQRWGGQGEGAYDLPSVPPAPGNNHRFWWDRDGVDPWQNAATANTGGVYQIVITLHATSASTRKSPKKREKSRFVLLLMPKV